MELVINISEDLYNAIMRVKNGKFPHHLSNAEYAIANGTPLPKGHGELIDARAFLQSINNSDYDTYNDYSNTFDWISDAEVLVKADKGEE